MVHMQHRGLASAWGLGMEGLKGMVGRGRKVMGLRAQQGANTQHQKTMPTPTTTKPTHTITTTAATAAFSP